MRVLAGWLFFASGMGLGAWDSGMVQWEWCRGWDRAQSKLDYV